MRQNLQNIAAKIGPGLVVLTVFTEGWLVKTGSAQADTLITTCGYVVHAAGKYRLAADLGPCPGDGIDIRTGNITLDLDGHTITGLANGTGAGIDVEIGGSQANGINIEGPGGIQKFAYGVLLSNIAKTQVHGVWAVTNSDYGIYATDAVNLQLQNNVLTHNGVYGLRLVNSSRSQVHDNHISGNGNSGASDAGGVQIAGGTGSQVHDNVVDSNQPFGIVLFNASNEQLYNNGLYGNYSSGIRAESGSTGNAFNDNVAEGNLIYDLEDDNIGCDTNKWQNNSFFTSNQTCIH